MFAAHKKVVKIMGEKAQELLPDRYPDYQADAVRTLFAVVNAQTTTEGEARRQNAVLAEIDTLAARVASKRGSAA